MRLVWANKEYGTESVEISVLLYSEANDAPSSSGSERGRRGAGTKRETKTKVPFRPQFDSFCLKALCVSMEIKSNSAKN